MKLPDVTGNESKFQPASTFTGYEIDGLREGMFSPPCKLPAMRIDIKQKVNNNTDRLITVEVSAFWNSDLLLCKHHLLHGSKRTCRKFVEIDTTHQACSVKCSFVRSGFQIIVDEHTDFSSK